MLTKLKVSDAQIERFMCKQHYISFYILLIGVPIGVLLLISAATFITMLPIGLIMGWL